MGVAYTSKILKHYTANLELMCTTSRQTDSENLIPQKCMDGNGTMILYKIVSVSFLSCKQDLKRSGMFSRAFIVPRDIEEPKIKGARKKISRELM